MSSYDGTTVGTYIASYSNHPLMFGAYAGSTPTSKMMILQGGQITMGSILTTYGTRSSINPTILTISKFAGGTATTTFSNAYYLGIGNQEYATNSYRLIGLGYSDTSSTQYPAYIGYQEATTSGYTYGDLIFGTRSTTGATDQPSERMRILSGGNVGINTASPYYTLHVSAAAWCARFGVTGSTSVDISGNQIQAVNGNATGSTLYLNWSYGGSTYVGGDIRSYGQIRATGWYNSNSSSVTGLATEIGVSGGGAYILSYNRDNATYGDLYVNSNMIGLDTQGGNNNVKISGIAGSVGRLRVTSKTNGETEINSNTYTVMLGPASTRTGAGYYYAGIAINGLMNYSGGTGYDTAAHIWLGAYYRDTPGSEHSDFVIAVKSGTGNTGTGSDVPQPRVKVDYTGLMTVSGDIVAYGSPSDIRKKIIKEVVPNALDSIKRISGYRFDWKEVDSLAKIKEDIGVIAQEVQDVLPELVRTNDDGYLSVRHQGLTAVLIEAIKEQQTQIEAQNKRIETLESLLKK